MILRVCGTPRKLQCPEATGALAVKLRKKMQGGDSDLSHQGVPGEQEAAWGELEEKEGEDDLAQSFQNPNIYRAERGREEPLQQTDRCEQKGRGATGEGGLPGGRGHSRRRSSPSAKCCRAAWWEGGCCGICHQKGWVRQGEQIPVGQTSGCCGWGADTRWDPGEVALWGSLALLDQRPW